MEAEARPLGGVKPSRLVTIELDIEFGEFLEQPIV